MADQPRIIQQIKESHLFAPHGQWDFKETELSYVFLTADKAYKIKKALNIGSLNLSAAENRRRFCEQEIEANREISPKLYLGLRTIYQRPDGTLTLEQTDTPAEFVVEMNRFPEDRIFLKMLESGTLEEAHLTQLTDIIARNHQEAPKSGDGGLYAMTCQEVDQALADLRNCPDIIDANLLDGLESCFMRELERNKNLIESREKTHVKLFQRDLALEGVCLHEGEPTFFDGMPAHREPQKADTMADLATLVIDLFYLSRRDLAVLVLNRYLKRTDDFDGLPLLRLYGALQALQRSVGHCMTCREIDRPGACEREAGKGRLYAELALLFMRETPRQRIVAVGGLSGAGKTTLARGLSQQIGALHIRADAVRKHLWGMPVYKKAPPEAYSEAHQEKTYIGLQERARKVLEAGLSVVVDGVFATEELRDGFSQFAQARGLATTTIWCMVPPAVAQKRIQERLRRAGKPPEDLGASHEKQLFLNPGRITWHRLDTVYGEENVRQRALDLIKLSSPAP